MARWLDWEGQARARRWWAGVPGSRSLHVPPSPLPRARPTPALGRQLLAAQGFGPTLDWLGVGLREARGARPTRPPASRRGVGSLSRETGTPASARAPRPPLRPAAHGLLIPLRASGTRHPAAARKALRPAVGNPRGHWGRTPAGGPGGRGRPPHPARPRPQRPTGGWVSLEPHPARRETGWEVAGSSSERRVLRQKEPSFSKMLMPLLRFIPLLPKGGVSSSYKSSAAV